MHLELSTYAFLYVFVSVLRSIHAASIRPMNDLCLPQRGHQVLVVDVLRPERRFSAQNHPLVYVTWVQNQSVASSQS